MCYRVLTLGFENVKRIFYKKTTLGVVIGLAFLIGYSTTTFLIGESNLEVNFSSNEFVIYFFNDFNIAGIFLNILYVVFIIGMFKDDINYMYIYRLKNRTSILLSWTVSIFLSTFVFILFVLGVVLITAGIIKDYSLQWSGGLINFNIIKEVIDPLSSIIISITMYALGLLILGICFYIGYFLFKSIALGIIFGMVPILIGGIVYAMKLKWIYKIPININSIFALHSINGSGDFPSISYSLIYIFLVMLLLYGIAVYITKKYVSEKL